jgi:hypothetical protein
MQAYIVALIILSALAFAGVTFWRKAQSFKANPGCDADCGCGGTSKKLST